MAHPLLVCFRCLKLRFRLRFFLFGFSLEPSCYASGAVHILPVMLSAALVWPGVLGHLAVDSPGRRSSDDVLTQSGFPFLCTHCAMLQCIFMQHPTGGPSGPDTLLPTPASARDRLLQLQLNKEVGASSRQVPGRRPGMLQDLEG